MSKSGAKNKGSGGLRVFWMPTGHKSHKHKRNKHFVRNNLDSPRSAMMSGDSPNSHSKDFFGYKDGRSTPPPTTSKDIAIQNNIGATDLKTEVVAASILAEPLKEHGPGANSVGVLDGHSDRKGDDEIATEDRPLRGDDGPDAGDRRHSKDDGSCKLNGNIDKLDGNWTAPSDMKKEEEEDDNCAVKCLYYTLQCCECIIM